MKFLIHLINCCLAVMFAVGCAHATQELLPVASQGETHVTSIAGKLKTQVKIVTHEVPIGKPGEEKPAVVQSSCTYSKYPCSVVDRIEISVNSGQLFIPRSVFCDLADLNKAEITEKEEGMVILSLYGGDASESYIVKIEFDAIEVKRRILSSAMSPEKPLQETTYYTRALGD